MNGPMAQESSRRFAAGSRLNASVKGSGAIDFLLSLDRAPGGGDVSLGRHQVKGSKALRLRVPRKTQLGAYYLLGCAPVTKPAKRPRCRSAKTRMAVTGAPRPARVRPTPDAARAVSARLGRFARRGWRGDNAVGRPGASVARLAAAPRPGSASGGGPEEPGRPR